MSIDHLGQVCLTAAAIQERQVQDQGVEDRLSACPSKEKYSFDEMSRNSGGYDAANGKAIKP